MAQSKSFCPRGEFFRSLAAQNFGYLNLYLIQPWRIGKKTCMSRFPCSTQLLTHPAFWMSLPNHNNPKVVAYHGPQGDRLGPKGLPFSRNFVNERPSSLPFSGTWKNNDLVPLDTQNKQQPRELKKTSFSQSFILLRLCLSEITFVHSSCHNFSKYLFLLSSQN